jgi:hypothetical protein
VTTRYDPSMRLARLFGAIVASVSACDPDAGAIDASAPDADAAAPNDAGAPDVAPDSYVAWCDAGPPELALNAGCNLYEYVPCGLPPEDIVATGGQINRCDQFCPITTDDSCAILGEPWIDLVFDAGDGSVAQTDGGVLVVCICSSGSGRRPRGLLRAHARARSLAGAFFSRPAHLEDASVIAFRRLRGELAALGMKPRLLRDVERAARDEIVHAEITSALSRRFGGRVTPARVRRWRRRSVLAIAKENAVEGCVRETFGALVATWQAAHARDRDVRRAMQRIAADETRHAELAARVDAALAPLLDDAGRRELQRARVRTASALRASLDRDPPPALVSIAGLPRRASALALFDAVAPLYGLGLSSAASTKPRAPRSYT